MNLSDIYLSPQAYQDIINWETNMTKKSVRQEKLELALAWFNTLSEAQKKTVFLELLDCGMQSGLVDVAVESYKGEFEEEGITWVCGEVYHEGSGESILEG